MIQSEWFDEQYTSTMYGDITITYLLHEITDARLADAGFNPMKAYAVGSIPAKYAKIIAGKHVTAPITNDYVIDTTDPTAVIKSTATTSKAFWGFGAWNPNYPITPCYFNQTFGRWGQSGVTYNQSPQFIQEMKAYGLRYIEPKISVQFKIVDTHTETTLQNNTITTCYANGDTDFGSVMTISLSQLRNFIENDTPISVTDANLGTKSLKFSDMIDNKFWLTGTNQYMYAEVYGQNYPQSYYKSNTQNTNIVPLASTMCGDDIILELPFYRLFESTQIALSDADGNGMSHIVYWTQGIYNGAANEYQSSNDWGYIGKDNSNFWGDPNEYELPVDTLAWLNPQPSGVKIYDFQNGLIWYYTGGWMSVGGRNLWRYATRRVVDFDVLYFYFGMFNRCIDPDDSTAPTDRYVTGDYISIYQNNIPKPEFIVYDGNYDPIVPRLMEWQQYGHDISEDDYAPEDPTPPGPGPRPEPVPPGSDENGGDDITLPSIAGLGGGFGFTTQYALRGSQLEQLGQALWAGFDTNNPDIDAYLQNFVYRVDPSTGSVNMADIMSFFISLRAYPMPLGNLASITAAGTDMYIGAGTAPLRKSDGTTPFTQPIHTLDSYLEEVDAGSVSVPFWFGDYRDYSTEIILYLPYCGTAELNPGDVMGGTLTATYVVDLSTGSCTAYVMCSTWDGKNYPVAVLPGQMGVDIPITATNAGRVGARLLGDRINVAENILSGVKSGITGIGAVMSGNFAGAVRSGVQTFLDTSLNEQKLLAGMAERGAISAPMLSGGRGLAAFKNPMTAYVQVRSPFYAVPDNYADTVGNPAAVAVTIGSCSGFCKFYNVDVTGITTDADDQQAIRAALETGIII